LVTDTCIDWVLYLEQAGFAAKKLCQLPCPAPLAIALFAAISLIGLNQGMAFENLDYYCSRLQHYHLPL
jgi:hypothetical protein